MTTDRVLVLSNPKAGPRSSDGRTHRLVVLLREAGLHVELFDDLAMATRAADELHAAGQLRALVGAGGDGTLAELVNRTVPGVPITALPSGNENLLARYLGIGASPEEVSRTIVGGTLRRLDAGVASGRIFLLMASCGFDADVVRRLHSRRRGHVSSRSYVEPILESLWNYRYPELRVRWDPTPAATYRDPTSTRVEVGSDSGTKTRPGTLWAPPPRPRIELVQRASLRWLFAFNLPCYGGGLQVAPQAVGTDGLLDLCGFQRGSIWNTLRYSAAVLQRRHSTLADCLVCRAGRLHVDSDAEVPYQLDGDPAGVLPVDIETLPGRLTMLVPS